MAESFEKEKSSMSLTEFIPKQVLREYFKVSEWQRTLWHVSQNLKVDLKWLQDNFWDFNNTQTIEFDKKTLVGKVATKYYWGEPRQSDEFAIVGIEWNYQLYRKRGNTIIFMQIPDEKVKPVQKALHALADQINQTLSA